MRCAALALLLSILIAAPVQAQSVIEDVIVETYYISDVNDATDTIGAGPDGLAVGSRTYRIFLDLCDSCALRSVFGDVNHPLSITSTAPFFNHLDRGKVFGHELNNSALDEGTTALDSWLSMGGASNQKFGVLKTEDSDGSIVGGPNNDGGSLPVIDGLLVNNDPDAGIALTTQDGLAPLNGGAILPPNFNFFGTDPDSAFFDSTLTSGFRSNAFIMGCSTPGVKGPTADNRILIAQITTAGELTFALNIEVEKADGTVLKLVSSDSILLADETANGLLVYPPVCGCTDPNFLEYDPNAGCDDGSCQTTIIFGCLDTIACNFDPLANFNVSALCCYGPDSCNGLDVTILCPDVSVNEGAIRESTRLYPNPSEDVVHVVPADHGQRSTVITIMDALGRRVLQAAPSRGPAQVDITLDALAPGAYLMIIRMDDHLETHRLVKR
jgi:hypothetical protein